MAKLFPISEKTGKKDSSRKAQEQDPFMYAFIVVLLIAAVTFTSQGGVVGTLFESLSNVMDQLGLSREATCPFFNGIGPIYPWACIFVFGIIPFIIVYYFTFDALSFTFMTTKTKSMLALGVSLIASIPVNGVGGQNSLLGNLSSVLTQFTQTLLGPLGGDGGLAGWTGFLAIILIMGLISGFMGQLAMTSQMTSAAVLSLQETVWGYRAMNSIGQTMTQKTK